MAFGQYARLSGIEEDQKLDEEMDSLLALPKVNPNQPREWLLIDAQGRTFHTLVDKHAIVAELGIHYRDLRILDPLIPTPYPTALFIRDKALVVNLESIRVIISSDQVFVLSVPEPGQSLTVGTFPLPTNPFVRDLVARLTSTQSSSSRTASSVDRSLPFELRALEAALAHTTRALEQESIQIERATLPSLKALLNKVSRQELDKVRTCKASLNKMMARVLELKQELEGMLDDDDDMADMYLSSRAQAAEQKSQLEAEEQLQPDSPTQSVASMESIDAADFMGQTDTDAEAPAHFSRHSNPMDKSYIQGVAPAQQAPPPPQTPFASASEQAQDEEANDGPTTRFSSISEAAKDIADNWHNAPQPRADAKRHSQRQQHQHKHGSLDSHNSSVSMKVATSAPPMETSPLVSPPQTDSRLEAAPTAPPSEFPAKKLAKHKGHKSHESKKKWRNKVEKITELLTVMDKMKAPGGMPFVHTRDISACEDLLEAYFMQVDFLLSRLKVLYERIDDTEDLINIELDHRRNELVALDLVVTAVSTMFAFVAMIGGVFGMNMKNGYEESHAAFLWATYGSTGGSIALFLGIILFARWKRLLFIPDASSFGSGSISK